MHAHFRAHIVLHYHPPPPSRKAYPPPSSPTPPHHTYSFTESQNHHKIKRRRLGVTTFAPLKTAYNTATSDHIGLTTFDRDFFFVLYFSSVWLFFVQYSFRSHRTTMSAAFEIHTRTYMYVYIGNKVITIYNAHSYCFLTELIHIIYARQVGKNVPHLYVRTGNTAIWLMIMAFRWEHFVRSFRWWATPPTIIQCAKRIFQITIHEIWDEDCESWLKLS